MPPDAKRSGPDPRPGRSRSISRHQTAEAEVIVTHGTVNSGDLLALSDERDQWLARLLAAEQDAYQRGFNDGRAAACAALAEIEERYAAAARWREWWARVARIIQAETDPSARMRQVMAEIAADQELTRDARARLAAKPGALSPLEACVLRRIRGAGPGGTV